jgi:hypothetical protein
MLMTGEWFLGEGTGASVGPLVGPSTVELVSSERTVGTGREIRGDAS